MRIDQNASATTMLQRLGQSFDSRKLDPRQYDKFTIEVTSESGAGGLFSGKLSEKHYAAFKEIVKDFNIMDASYGDMAELTSRFVKAGVLPLTFSLGGFWGPVEFDGGGQQVNRDKKYNQLEWHRTMLPGYDTPDFAQIRDDMIIEMKTIAAIANASAKTGETVSKNVLVEPSLETSRAEVDISSITGKPSNIAKLLAAYDMTKIKKEMENIDLDAFLKQLEELLEHQKSANVKGAILEVSSS